jgi:hypothetical protein
MTTKTITEEEMKLRDQIHQLVLVAETFSKYTEEISTYYDELKNKFGLAELRKTKLVYFLIMQQKLHFQEAILIMCTLFEKPGRKQEVSFESYKKLSMERESLNEINELSTEFYNSAFFSFRDKLLAHKDKELEINQAFSYWNPIEKRHIQEMRLYIDKIKIIFDKYWKDKIANNYFADIYDPGFDQFFGMVKQNISFEIRKLRGEL